ncbi:MAG: hypothetical protein DYH14_11195 [Betaproteobacteria bacterium PRO3]|nr:hypothetical protein [Betaproteobacteria bacterium PRO3]
MHRSCFLAVALSASVSVSAATTYQYVGPTYSIVSGPYATSQRVTGQFTTATPLAPNLPSANILAQVTSYSFSDGVHTYASSDPNARVYSFVAGTDATGAIANWALDFQVWTSGSIPHGAGDHYNEVRILGTGDYAMEGATCSTTGTSVAGVADSCTVLDVSGLVTGQAYTPQAAGTWTKIAPVVPVPTNSQEGVTALAVALMAIAAATLRRRRTAAGPRGGRR